MYIPENIIDQIQSRTDIVEIIQEHIPLKKTGANFSSVCPFHQEKTPSFIVSPERQIFHCFGCGVGGNVFTFLMKYERLDFPEVIQILARRTGISLPENTQESFSKSALQKEHLYSANKLASVFYQKSLLNGFEAEKARDYLSQRGFSKEVIDKYKIGFAPKGWRNLLNYAKGKGIKENLLEKTGLVIKAEDGSYYDRFRERIIFPIIDTVNRVVGFGARVLDESLPKYLNSPESEIFSKKRQLYGMNIVKNEYKQRDRLFVVEGYADVIGLAQFGIKNTVASLGTSLTLEQAKIIKRYVSQVILIYDADLAGEAAALRALDVFIEQGLDIKILTLPKGEDPDSYVRSYGKKSFIEKTKEAKDLFDYKLQCLLKKYDIRDTHGRLSICNEILESVVKIENIILRSDYIRRLAEAVSIKEDALLQYLRKLKPTSKKPLPPILGENAKGMLKKDYFNKEVSLVEKMILGFIFSGDEKMILTIRNNIDIDYFQYPLLRELIDKIFQVIDTKNSLRLSFIMAYFNDENINSLIAEGLSRVDTISDENKEKALGDCIRKLKSEFSKNKLLKLKTKIGEAERTNDKENLNSLLKEYNNLLKNNLSLAKPKQSGFSVAAK